MSASLLAPLLVCCGLFFALLLRWVPLFPVSALMMGLDLSCVVSDVIFGGVWCGVVHAFGDACLPLRCAGVRGAPSMALGLDPFSDPLRLPNVCTNREVR